MGLHGNFMTNDLDGDFSPLDNRERDFDSFVSEQLEPFWQQQSETGHFVNHQGLDIHYARLINESAKHAVVVSPGRVEGYLKYKELAFDFFHQGYSVFIIDHQGQGLSSRRLTNEHKGHVDHFQDYVNDFEQFIQQVVRSSHVGDLYLLGHSMGSAIGIRYIQQFPATFVKASFSSPMWGFRSGAMPELFAKNMVKFGHWFSQALSKESAYFLGGKDYDAKPFNENELTGSEVRYRYFRDLYIAEPKLQLGSITFSWLNASIAALEQAYQDLDKISMPIQVLQAEDETVIDNEAQDRFCQRLQELEQPCFQDNPFVIKGAKHELFIESDDKRQVALRQILTYFDSE